MIPSLRFEHVSLKGRVQSVDLQICGHQRTALLGSSGAGKSTLIALANGSLGPDSGQVLWSGIPVCQLARRHRREIGTLWQDLRLVEELTALQNINAGALGRHSFLWACRNLLDRNLCRSSCQGLLAEVGLDETVLDQPIRQLSGGQRQRIAMARLMRQAPRFVLADEPLSALDPVLAEDVLRLLLAQPGCLVSLHRPDLIHRFDRVLGLRHGAVVIDEPADRLSEQTIQWLYSSP